MQIVKSVGVMSVAKIMALIHACLGVVFAPFFLLIGLLGSLAGQHKNPFAGAIGIVFALLMPFFYGIIGFLTGAIGGALYNLFAKLVGGFEVELELKPDTLSAPYPIVPPPNPTFSS
jgi:type III secretory pathway component EscU